MPAHEWNRLSRAGFFDFRLAWLVHLRDCLNAALLSPDYYAQLEAIELDGNSLEADIYASNVDWIVIHHVSDDRMVALIEIVSPGNKHTKSALDRLVKKLDELFLDQKPLLLIDVFPPGKHDPRGVHESFWSRHYDECPGVSAEKPVTLAAYRSGHLPTAYFEPSPLGQPLREMPLFLEPNWYVNVPLEETYRKAFAGIPAKWQRVLERNGEK